MPDNTGGIGIAGVLIGALLVIVVGGALLLMTGVVGKRDTAAVTIQLPKVLPSK